MTSHYSQTVFSATPAAAHSSVINKNAVMSTSSSTVGSSRVQFEAHVARLPSANAQRRGSSAAMSHSGWPHEHVITPAVVTATIEFLDRRLAGWAPAAAPAG